jgi:hypothetical protein
MMQAWWLSFWGEELGLILFAWFLVALSGIATGVGVGFAELAQDVWPEIVEAARSWLRKTKEKGE